MSYFVIMRTKPQELSAPLDVIIGENIHRHMWRARKSQTELALQLGMTQGALSRKLRGERPWFVDEIKGAADTFGVSIGSLFVSLPDQDSNLEPAGLLQDPKTHAKEWQKSILLAHDSVRGLSGRTYSRGTATQYKSQKKD